MANPYSPYDFTPEPESPMQGVPDIIRKPLPPGEIIGPRQPGGLPGAGFPAKGSRVWSPARLRAMGWTADQIQEYYDWLQQNPDIQHGNVPGAQRGLPPGMGLPRIGNPIGTQSPVSPQGGGSTFNALLGAAKEME